MKPKVLSQVTAGVADLYETAHSKAESQRAVSSVLKDDFVSCSQSVRSYLRLMRLHVLK